MSKCQIADCPNAARYTTVRGIRTCATCPIVHKLDAIRDADVEACYKWWRRHTQWIHNMLVLDPGTTLGKAKLLFFAREWLRANGPEHPYYAHKLLQIIGKDLSETI